MSLFGKMASTYGALFADKWRDVEPEAMKLHWAEALGVLRTDELTRGVRLLVATEWPPTLPEFLMLCRPCMVPQIAYEEALEQGGRRERGEACTWSSPAVYWAWRKIGKTAFANQSYAALSARWEVALATEFAKDLIEPIPPQMPALVPPGRTALSVERARQLLPDMAAMTRLASTTVAGDSKRWARRLLERRAAGELLEIEQIKCAEQALGGA